MSIKLSAQCETVTPTGHSHSSTMNYNSYRHLKHEARTVSMKRLARCETVTPTGHPQVTRGDTIYAKSGPKYPRTVTPQVT